MTILEEIGFLRTKIMLDLGYANNSRKIKIMPLIRISDRRLADKLLSRTAIIETFLKREGLEDRFLKWTKENVEAAK